MSEGPGAAGTSNAGAGADEGPVSEQQIVKVFTDMMENRRMLVSKIGELEAQWSEHK